MDAETWNQALYEKMSAEQEQFRDELLGRTPEEVLNHAAIPLYQESIKHVKEHGEIDVRQASHEANIACRDVIEAAIRAGHDGQHLTVDTEGVLAEFGPERVSHRTGRRADGS